MTRLALLFFFFAWLAACDATNAQTPCRNIPDGGCPLSYGVACDDPACAAAYACNADGTWRLDHTCAPRDAGGDVHVGPKDAGAKDVDLDVQGAFGGPGCIDLQSPDCPYGLAATCGAGCCGCSDLFVCRDGGWSAYGSCVDGAIVP